mgnify:CR=1 FL=1
MVIPKYSIGYDDYDDGVGVGVVVDAKNGSFFLNF